KHFASIDALREATIEEIAALPQMNIKAANEIYEFLHNQDKKDEKDEQK
ncbi:MAG: hypothetical protein GX567_17005, partial [Clostridia bacterium]|nr:hypothetical protein [Clostridia bacterium]